MSIEEIKTEEGQGGLPYSHCLNCGSELKGKYCHNCGQEVVDKTPTVWGFIVEYFNNAFIWDSNFVRTFWTLIRRPGRLTNDYIDGKFVSQEHPLKLNMFLLFVIITMFALFTGTDKLTSTVHNLTSDEKVFAGVQMNILDRDEAYAKLMKESPRDTILLHAPLFLAQEYPHLISSVEVKEDTKGERLDRWVAVVPRVLVDDKIVVAEESGYYCFNTETKGAVEGLHYFNSIWSEMVGIASQYFPLILLLTVPFLSFSLNLVQRKSRRPRIHHFIFSLHYTALLEILMICIYILHLTIAPPMWVMESVILVGSCLYLTIAYRRVYEKTWRMAIVKSLSTSLIYFMILMLIFVTIFLVACFIIASEVMPA